MNECSSIETIDKTNLSNQTKFRLDEISKIENYFIDEIYQRKSCSKKLSKYAAVFDYIDQALIVLSATNWWSINYFVHKYCWSTSWNSKCKPFSNNRIVKKLLNIKRKKKKKHDKILIWLKVN